MKCISQSFVLAILLYISFYHIQIKMSLAQNMAGRGFLFRAATPKRPVNKPQKSPLPPPTITQPKNFRTVTQVNTMPIFQNVPVLTSVDYASSKRLKLSWYDAKNACQLSGLVLLVLYSEGDNKVLNQDPQLKVPPLTRGFWSGARFTSAEFKKLMWEPVNKEFPSFMSGNANGIIKLWDIGEPADYSGLGKDLCVEMKFSANTPPIWSSSDCDDKNYFICVRPADQRGQNLNPVVILGDEPKIIPTPVPAPVPPPIPVSIPVPTPVTNVAWTGPQPLYGNQEPSPGLYPNNEVKVPTPLTGVDVAASVNEKCTWEIAKLRCEESGLMLLVVNSELSNQFLNSGDRWIQMPYSKKETFWSGAKFESTEYKKLKWEPTGEEIDDFRANNGSGINKEWEPGEPYDDDGEKAEICIDMSFPGPTGGPPVWRASNCSEKRHYICVRPAEARSTRTILPPVKILNDVLTNAVFGIFVLDRNPDIQIGGYMKTEEKSIFTQSDYTKQYVYPISGTWKPNDNTAEVHGILKQNDNLAKTSAYFSTCRPCSGDKILGEPGKFYSDIFPDRSVSGSIPDEPPRFFIPMDLAIDINRAQNGTWIPDEPHPIGNPFAAMHGEMQIIGGQPIFIPNLHAESIFIPDVTQIPLPGSLNLTGKNKPFTLTNASAFNLLTFSVRGVPGYWRQLSGKISQYHYSTIHGRLTGINSESLSFVPDASLIEGEFRIPEWVGPSLTGDMSQGFPSMFRVSGKQLEGLQNDDVVGIYKPKSIVSPILPFRGVHGKLSQNKKYGNSFAKYFNFVPFEKVSGVFVNDENPEEDITGEATQTNPSQFIPDKSFVPINTSISGTWCPTGSHVQDDPNFYTHCVLSPSEDTPGTYLFSQDFLTPGIFKSTENPNEAIIGSMTQGSMPVFRPINILKFTFNSVTPGVWIAGSITTGFQASIAGSLKPSKNLPLNVYFFTLD